eukprot:TRINITY_DN12146_c0_g1_i1.p1 TRINITY_DN12146_c0_g1~~TRINITY_DN12146_c0_g1_i1.p1  ORF type:complete len:615 (+),score=173.04 TRINITY_DN12146_c0_g1_i1:210-1847(+)
MSLTIDAHMLASPRVCPSSSLNPPSYEAPSAPGALLSPQLVPCATLPGTVASSLALSPCGSVASCWRPARQHSRAGSAPQTPAPSPYPCRSPVPVPGHTPSAKGRSLFGRSSGSPSSLHTAAPLAPPKRHFGRSAPLPPTVFSEDYAPVLDGFQLPPALEKRRHAPAYYDCSVRSGSPSDTGSESGASDGGSELTDFEPLPASVSQQRAELLPPSPAGGDGGVIGAARSYAEMDSRFEVDPTRVSQGRFSEVLFVKSRETGEEAVCKVPRESGGRELTALQMVQHVNVVRLLDSWTESPQADLVILLEKGWRSVARVFTVSCQTGVSVPEAFIRKVMADAGAGLQHLHERDWCHIDVKPDNILQFETEGEEPLFKICDLGMAVYIGQSGTVPAAYNELESEGDVRYMDMAILGDVRSEVLRGADAYGLSLTGYELLSGEPLLADSQHRATIRQCDEPLFRQLADKGRSAGMVKLVRRGMLRELTCGDIHREAIGLEVEAAADPCCRNVLQIVSPATVPCTSPDGAATTPRRTESECTFRLRPESP